MSDNGNLRPFNRMSKEEAYQIRAKGGRNSGRAKRLQKEMKQKLQLILSLPASDRNKAKLLSLGIDQDDEVDNMLVVAASLFREAAKGNVRAIEQITGGMDESEARIKKLEAEVLKYKRESEFYKEQTKQLKTADKQDDGFVEALTGTAEGDWADADE